MGTGFPNGSCSSKNSMRNADAKPNGNSRRNLDVGRRRGLRARDGQADRRGAAAAVVVSRRRRGAGKRCCGRTGGGADLEAAQRAVAGRRRRHAPRRGRMPERALPARRRQAAAAGLGQDRRQSTRRATGASCGCTPISGITATPSARFWAASRSATTCRPRCCNGMAKRSKPRPMPMAASSP